MTNPTRSQIEKLWRAEKQRVRNRRLAESRKQKRLDPGRKPKGALTIHDLQNLPADKWPGVWPEIWDGRKRKR